MPSPGWRRTGVGDADDEIPAIRAVPHRHVDALIREDARDDEMADAEVAQEIVDVGRVEDARGRLRQQDLVAHGSERPRRQPLG